MGFNVCFEEHLLATSFTPVPIQIKACQPYGDQLHVSSNLGGPHSGILIWALLFNISFADILPASASPIYVQEWDSSSSPTETSPYGRNIL
jgi:hypothetical protein